VPIPFELSYDAARIDPRFAYQIEARINHGDELLFISTESFPVITRGNPATIAVRVDQVR
jgi:putative lipoprotein